MHRKTGNSTLSDQVGAMAFVDELRAQRNWLQDHLDLPKRRAEVAERIRTYYRRQGIDCDDELVERGVHEFFGRRLRYQAPELRRFDKVMAKLVVHHQTLNWILTCAVLILFLTFKLAPAP